MGETAAPATAVVGEGRCQEECFEVDLEVDLGLGLGQGTEELQGERRRWPPSEVARAVAELRD